jgi:hypothetical protein
LPADLAGHAGGVQGGEGGDQGDADCGEQPLGASSLVAGVCWGAKHVGAPGVGCGGPGLVPAGPPQGKWSVVQVALGSLALVEGVGVGVVVVGQVGRLDQGVGEGP